MPTKKSTKPKPILKALRCRNRLAKLARPCIILDTATKNLPFAGEQLSKRSFVGGNPLLPFDFKWPTAKLKLNDQRVVVLKPHLFTKAPPHYRGPLSDLPLSAIEWRVA